MSGQVLTAVIAASASLVIAVVSIWKSLTSERQLAKLRSDLEERRAEADARRSYEYEARKRLYTECEPILFHAGEVARDARGRIASLARSARRGQIEPDGTGWLTTTGNAWLTDGYYFKSTLFLLLVPHAAFKLLQRRLTAIDLGLEPRIWTQYELLKVLYDSFTEDFELAKRERPWDYEPDEADPGKPRREELLRQRPAKYARQGFYRGTFERVVEAFVKEAGEDATEPGGSVYGSRAKTFGEFSRDLADEGSKIAPLIGDLSEVFSGFHPSRKPVLWRVLLAQELLYDVLLRFSRDSNEAALGSLAGKRTEEDALADLAWLPGEGSEAEMLRELRAASDYVQGKLAEIDERLGLSRSSE